MTTEKRQLAWFLFTDIEGSTSLWESYPAAMPAALARHDDALVRAITEAGGSVVKHTGDGLMAVFTEPATAILAAVSAQRNLSATSFTDVGKLAVRMGINGGAVNQRDDDYFGTTLNRAARVMSAAHGGQVLVSDDTLRLAGESLQLDGGLVTFLDLGLHRLSGLARPERIFQVCHDSLERTFPPLRSQNLALGNLPPHAGELYGRSADLDLIVSRLREHSLVTLIGPGGIGKTALALAVARAVASSYPDGVWFCDLTAIRRGDHVAQSILSALRIERRTGQSEDETLREVFSSRQLLLVLDNCEHLVRDVRRVIAQVLSDDTSAHLLATSRVRLSVAGEVRVPITPIAVPGDHARVEELSANASVRLFVERAREAGQEMSVTGADGEALVKICNELEGLPLALELAAARTQVMSVTAIASRLDHRLQLLRRSDEHDDHRSTVEATLAWSFELLTAEQQELFGLLGCFGGGFDLEGLVAVASRDEFDTLDQLQVLVENSIVSVDSSFNPVRYRLLEVVREFAVTKLETRSDGAEVRARHAHHYAAWVDAARDLISTEREADCLDAVRTEFPNLRLAFQWMLENDPTAAAEMSLRLWPLWTARGLIDVGLRWLRRCEEVLPPSHPLSARVLDDIAQLLWVLGENDESEATCRASMAVTAARQVAPTLIATVRLACILALAGRRHEALALHEGLEERVRNEVNRSEASRFLSIMAFTEMACGNQAVGQSLSDDALLLAADAGPGYLCAAYGNAALTHILSSPARARELATVAVAHARALRSNYNLANALRTLAVAERNCGDHAASRRTCAEALIPIRDAGMRNNGATILENLAHQLDHMPRASATLFGAVSRLREEIHYAGHPIEQATVPPHLQILREALGDEEFEVAWSEGRALSFDDAVDVARAVVEESVAADEFALASR